MSGKETVSPMPTACVSTTTSEARAARRRRPVIRTAAVAAVLLAVAFLPGLVGHGRAADGSGTSGDGTRAKADQPTTAGTGAKGAAGDSVAGKPPACRHCGATCGLEPVCVCRPGTKKKPVTEYATTCEPFCVPGCSGPPWFRHGGGCAGCADECGRCPGSVRSRKKLSKDTRDEEVPVVTRTVEYVCCDCRPRSTAGCCDVRPEPRAENRAPWWAAWLPWSLR